MDSRAMVPGRSAYVLASLRKKLTVAGFVPFFAALLLFFLDDRRQTPLLTTGIILIICAFLIMSVMTIIWICSNFRESEELRNGYTTLHSLHQDAEERDWRTRQIVRAAGEPYLSKEERVARLAGGQDATGNPEYHLRNSPAAEPQIVAFYRRQRPYAISILTLILILIFLRLTTPYVSFITDWMP